MGLARSQTNVTWATAGGNATPPYIDINSASLTTFTSDVVSIDSACVGISVQVSVDNQGTPIAADIATIGILWSNGDLDGNASDEYDTVGYQMPLMVLDTYTGTPANGICIRTLPIDPMMGKSFKIVASNSGWTSTHNLRVAIRLHITTAS
jgi:hypothetical protein